MQARDNILGDLPAQVRGLRDRITRRTSALAQAFGSWCESVQKADLEGVRQQAREIEDPAQLIEFISGWVEKIEEMEGVKCQLFRLDEAIAQALKIE